MQTIRNAMAYVAFKGKKLKFYESIMSSLSGKDVTSVSFSYKHVGDEVEIFPDPSGIPLFGPDFCPFKEISADSIEPEKQEKFIPVACVGLLVSSDEKVLLTRRPAHMRAFPLIWVPPGGHVDPYEKLESTVQREVFEETGLEMPLSLKPIMAWESTYPVRLEIGLPRKHHLVLYYLGVSRETSETLTGKLSLSKNEADGYMWMNKISANKLLFPDFELLSGYVYDSSSESFSSVTYELSDFIDEMKKERISTGTKFALYTWSNT